MRLLSVACALRSRFQLFGIYRPLGRSSLFGGYEVYVQVPKLDVGRGSLLLVAGCTCQLHVASVIRASQFFRDHVLHLELVVRIPVAAVVADSVILPVEPVPLILSLGVVLALMVVIGPAGIGGLWR